MDELSGGHTIVEHTMKSEEYLIDRLDTLSKYNKDPFSSSYYNIFTTLYAINLAIIEYPTRFNHPLGRQVVKINTVIPVGSGYNINKELVNQLTNAIVIADPSGSKKGFMIRTTYPCRG